MYFPSLLPSIVQVRAKVSSEWVVRMSSQSFDRADEYEIEVMGGNFREARGIDNEVAFLSREPCESSNDLESLTTEVQRRLRSREAVNSCFPSSP